MRARVENVEVAAEDAFFRPRDLLWGAARYPE